MNGQPVSLCRAAFVLGLAAPFLGCDTGSFYVYLAQVYDAQLGCLSDVEAVDIFQGPDPGTGCAPKCLIGADPDGGTVVYATTMCGPVPGGVDSSGVDPRCTAALAALQQANLCPADGGMPAPVEAGADAQSGPQDAAAE